jgi:polysaccharide chain length determinant protein (PEP-CTERM system associated)
MHDVMVQLMRYARGVWHYRWWLLGIAWVVCLVGWIIVARLPDQYQASARVYVDTQSVLRPFLRGLAIETGNTERKVLLMTRTLLSQPNLEKVLRMTDLDLKAQTDAQKDELLERLRKGISLAGTRRENLYTITYQDDSPELAKLVVKSLLTLFMESNLGEARKEQDSATQFLQQQIADYERRMRDMEENMTRFKQRNLGYLPNEHGGYYERIRNIQNQREQAALDLKVAEDRAESLRLQLQGEEPSFGVGPQVRALDVDTSVIDNRINATEKRLDDMLLKYTDKHPDVIALRAMIKDLERQRKEQIAEARRKAAKDPRLAEASESPYMQQLRITLSEAEADVAAKKVLVTEFDKRSNELSDAIERVLRVEGEQRQMTRDYQVLKKNYDSLVSRLEAAKLARKADSSTDTVQFRVIDPPRVPAKPSGPNRVFLSVAVLLVALGSGFVVAFVMSQLRPTFDERQLMNDILGLPVLGSVNMVWTVEQIRARKVRNVSFVFSLTALILTFGVVLALYQLNIDLLPRLAKSLDLN